MPDATDSPLAKVTGGELATEAFELLSDETRLAILVALWERDEPFADEPAVRFSELRERVGTRDSGRFSYHLDRLDGHFLESTAEGYELTEAGRRLVRTVVAGAGIETPDFEARTVDQDCGLCGAPVEVDYEEGWVYVRCTGCEGIWTDLGDHESGHLAKFSLAPAGLRGRSADEIYAAAWIHAHYVLYPMLEGVCPTCTGVVDRWLAVCEDHDAGESVCDACGRRGRAVGRLRCTVCKKSGQMTLGGVARFHPAVVDLYYAHGLALQYGFDDLDQIDRRLTRGSTDVEVLAAEPARVRVTTRIDGDAVTLELEDSLRVVDVDA